MKIAIGSDFIAEGYKKELVNHLKELGHIVIESKSNELYPIVAFDVSKQVLENQVNRGILICGTGIGMCIAANKVKGIYAACATTKYQAERAVLSNNANVLTLGCYNNSIEEIKEFVDVYLNNTFDVSSKSSLKIQEIYNYEKG